MFQKIQTKLDDGFGGLLGFVIWNSKNKKVAA